jgi:type I restriction enzyme M protein
VATVRFSRLRINANLFELITEEFVRGKRQNYLSEEHIEKIVSTYQNQEDVDRYSRRGSMEKFELEGFILNISRPGT